MLRSAFRSTLMAAALLAGGSSPGLIATLSAADCPCPTGHSASAQTVSHAGCPGGCPAGTLGHTGGPVGYAGGAGGYGPGGYGPGGVYPAAGYGHGNGPLATAIASHYAPNCRPQVYGQPDLFASYYVPPTCGGATGSLYPAPYGGITPLVGHTYYTYQPFAPHEQLYPHHRYYHRYYNGGRGLTRTRVHWYYPPVRAGAESVLNHFKLAR